MRWSGRMKYRQLLFLLIPLVLSGCATAIYATGKHGDVLRKGVDRQAIVDRLGEPIECSFDKFGHDYEVFRARGKVVPNRETVNEFGMGEGMAFMMFFGALEPLYLSVQLVYWPFLAIGEKDVCVAFDQDGKYLYHEVHCAKRRDK